MVDGFCWVGSCHFLFADLREKRSVLWRSSQVLHSVKMVVAHRLKIADVGPHSPHSPRNGDCVRMQAAEMGCNPALFSLAATPPMAGMEARPWGPGSQALTLSTLSFLHRLPNHPAAFHPKHYLPQIPALLLRDIKCRQPHCSEKVSQACRTCFLTPILCISPP